MKCMLQILHFNVTINDTRGVSMKKGKLTDRVIDLINSCKDEELAELSVDSIAEQLGVNPSYLSRKFNDDRDITLNAFITDVKMQRCVNLLKKNKKVTPVTLAQWTGFARSDYFVTLFRNKFGIHPRTYARLKS